jgi:hypothetical protein
MWDGPHTIMQIATSDGWFDYLEDINTASLQRLYVDPKLAEWNTAGLADGIWEIMIEAKDGFGGYWPAQSETCPAGHSFPGQTIGNVKVCLDNTIPKGEITIDFLSDSDFIASGGTAITTPATACGDFIIDKHIIGRFSVTDDSKDSPPAPKQPHFGEFSLGLLPFPSTFSHSLPVLQT